MKQDSYQEIIVPMEDEERTALHKRLRMFVGIALIIELFAMGMMLFFLRDFLGNDWTDYIFFGFIGIFMLGVAGVIVYAVRLIFRDLQSGNKKIIRGTVNGKREEVYRRASSSSGSNINYYYYLTIGGEDFKVEANAYQAVKTGDMVQVHFTLYSQTMLSYEVMATTATDTADQTVSPSAVEDASREVFRELPLTAGERAVLWRLLLRRLLLGAIFIFVGGIVVFLSVIAMMLAWANFSDVGYDNFAVLRWGLIFYLIAAAALALFILYRQIKHPLRDLLRGQKLYTIAIVTDKQEIRSLNNRDQIHYELYLNSQPFRVIQSAYDRMAIGEKLMTAQAPLSKVIFSITLADGTVL